VHFSAIQAVGSAACRRVSRFSSMWSKPKGWQARREGFLNPFAGENRIEGRPKGRPFVFGALVEFRDSIHHQRMAFRLLSISLSSAPGAFAGNSG